MSDAEKGLIHGSEPPSEMGVTAFWEYMARNLVVSEGVTPASVGWMSGVPQISFQLGELAAGGMARPLETDEDAKVWLERTYSYDAFLLRLMTDIYELKRLQGATVEGALEQTFRKYIEVAERRRAARDNRVGGAVVADG